MLTFTLAVLAFQPAPLDLDCLTVEHARRPVPAWVGVGVVED